VETASNNLSVDQLEQARYRLGQYLYHTHYIIIQVQTGPVSIPHTLHHHTGTETGPISVPHTLYHHIGTDWANICTPHIISSYRYRLGQYLYHIHYIIIQVQRLGQYLYHTHYIIIQVQTGPVSVPHTLYHHTGTDWANICTQRIISFPGTTCRLGKCLYSTHYILYIITLARARAVLDRLTIFQQGLCLLFLKKQ
jgi:hypothetical protein